jgi:hypothetical protein
VKPVILADVMEIGLTAFLFRYRILRRQQMHPIQSTTSYIHRKRCWPVTVQIAPQPCLRGSINSNFNSALRQCARDAEARYTHPL